MQGMVAWRLTTVPPQVPSSSSFGSSALWRVCSIKMDLRHVVCICPCMTSAHGGTPASSTYKLVICTLNHPAHQYQSSAWTVTMLVTRWEASSETLLVPAPLSPKSWPGLTCCNIGDTVKKSRTILTPAHWINFNWTHIIWYKVCIILLHTHFDVIILVTVSPFCTCPPTKLQELNVFIRVCQSIHKKGGPRVTTLGPVQTCSLQDLRNLPTWVVVKKMLPLFTV